jgi:choline kinase
MKGVILAAGMGSRLGRPHPKSLTRLATGQSILEHQVENLTRYLALDDVYVVVGFKNDLVMEAQPALAFVYNDAYDRTNTSKSLVRGLRKLIGHDVLWLNGDVVFDHRVLARLIQHPHSCMAVNTASVAEEEIKYRIGPEGWIAEVSKRVSGALGEAVGVNKVRESDLVSFIASLETCGDGDYFERGIELGALSGLRFYPVDVSDLVCTEIDFDEDLVRANRELMRLDGELLRRRAGDR